MDLSTELVVLASGGAGTLVGAMTTDAWNEAKSAVAKLWRRHRPDEEGDVQQWLESSRDEVLAAPESAADVTRTAVEQRWCELFEDLLEKHPDAADELDQVMASIAAAAAGNRAGSVTQVVRAGHDAFTAGRDQTVNLRASE